MKTVYVLVKVEIPKNSDANEVIQEADYSFKYKGKELNTEIKEQFDYYPFAANKEI